jgi:hypothetical protein
MNFMAKKPGNKVKRRASLSASENKKKEQHTENVDTQRPKTLSIAVLY